MTRTPKEDFLALLNGELPESIPYFSMGMPVHGKEPVRTVNPKLFDVNPYAPGGGYDIWGVKYVANEETGFAALPEPNNFILDDITKWRDVIKAPEVPEVDWEKMAEEDIKNSGVDRNITGIMCNADYSPFQQLVGFMGFEGALCAMYEEPEEVKALLNYMADFYIPIIEKTLTYYKPDFFYMADDTASKYNPFFSVEMYRDIFKPIYERIAKPANDRNIPIGFHNCGRCEDFIDDMLDFGVKFWDPAQQINDIKAIKEKYKGRLVVCGVWEAIFIPNWPDSTDEEIRQSIRDILDTYAPGGGYAFCGGILGAAGDDEAKRRQEIVRNEAMEYGKNYYEKNNLL